jgi:hypothetical protein
MCSNAVLLDISDWQWPYFLSSITTTAPLSNASANCVRWKAIALKEQLGVCPIF